MQWGKRGPWTLVDPDPIELHNTNRCVLFFPDDAGWPDGPAERKTKCLAQCISDARHIDNWHGDAPETREDFDTVLVLTNEHNVRAQMSHRNDPIQFQATTSRTWLAQLHRYGRLRPLSNGGRPRTGSEVRRRSHWPARRFSDH